MGEDLEKGLGMIDEVGSSGTPELVTLEEQDRSLWKRDQVAEGIQLTDHALRSQRIGPYQLQAAIGALHAQAERREDTDWRQIAALYERLLRLQPSHVVALNHAVAIAELTRASRRESCKSISAKRPIFSGSSGMRSQNVRASRIASEHSSRRMRASPAVAV
jgi:hypothetical protein